MEGIITLTKLTPRDFPKDPISRVGWLQINLNVADQFFLNLLKINGDEFAKWKKSETQLSEDNLKTLDNLWLVVTNLRDLSNNDKGALKNLFEYVAKKDPKSKPIDPRRAIPWAETSIKNFIEQQGNKAISDINYWIYSLKFR